MASMMAPVLRGVKPGKERGVRRYGPVGRRKAPLIKHALLRDAVDIGRGFAMVAVAGEVFRPRGIEDDADDVRQSCGQCHLSLPSRATF